MPQPINTSFSSRNHLFTLTRQAVRLPNLVAVLGLSVGFFLIGQLVGAIILFPLLLLLPVITNATAHSALLAGVQEALTVSLLFIPTGGLLWLWLRQYERRSFWTLGFERERAKRCYGRGAIVGLLLLSSVMLILTGLGMVAIEPGLAPTQGGWGMLGVGLALGGYMVQGTIEECICRGWLLSVVGARYRWQLGVAISSVVFALIHTLNQGVTGLALVNLFLIGVFLALYALRDGGLWGVSAFHAVWNWLQGNGFGLAVSGFPPSAASLLRSTETATDFVTGGEFGPEGGIVVTCITAVAIGFLCRSNQTSRSEMG